jgi:hypothetical protein
MAKVPYSLVMNQLEEADLRETCSYCGKKVSLGEGTFDHDFCLDAEEAKYEIRESRSVYFERLYDYGDYIASEGERPTDLMLCKICGDKIKCDEPEEDKYLQVHASCLIYHLAKEVKSNPRWSEWSKAYFNLGL